MTSPDNHQQSQGAVGRFKVIMVTLLFVVVNLAILIVAFNSKSGMSVAAAASVTGRVTLNGKPPPEIPLQLDPACAKLWAGQKPTTRFYLVGTDGGLGDVFVYVKSCLTNLSFGSPTNPVIMRKTGCFYADYIVGAQTGQPITVRNTDPILCNLHLTPTNPANREWNKAMMPRPAAGMAATRPTSRIRAAWETLRDRVARLLGRPLVVAPVTATEITFQITALELPARLKCDVHPWEFGYVFCVDHPYFAVTDSNGQFCFPQPPPPGRYVLEAFHRKAGSQTREIEVKAGEPLKVEFDLTVPK